MSMFRKLTVLAGAAEAGRRYARNNPEKVAKYADQAAEFVNKQTKGKYRTQVDGAVRKVHDLGGHDTGGRGTSGPGTGGGGFGDGRGMGGRDAQDRGFGNQAPGNQAPGNQFGNQRPGDQGPTDQGFSGRFDDRGFDRR